MSDRTKRDASPTKKSKSSSNSSKQSERRLVEYFVVVSSIAEKDLENDENTDQEANPNLDKLKLQDEEDEGDYDDDDDDDDDDESEDEEDDDEEEFVDDFDFQPVITSRYPLKDHEENPLHNSITCFCHPTGSIRLRTDPSMPKIHYFAATGGAGNQLYGTCLTVFEPFIISSKKKKKNKSESNEKEVYLPKCICILSNYPYLVAFREFLCQLHRLTKSGEMTLPVERYITNFCSEIPAPPPGSAEIQTTILDSVIKFWRPPHNQPIPWVALPFSHLFQCLDIDNIITVWHALALEHQVLLTSTQLSLLTTCAEIFKSLLFPMKWSHAYIPVVPHFLVPILSAPMPFLCGIDKLILPSAMLDLSKECIMVDLDKNQVTFGPMTPPLPPIPHHHKIALKQKLEDKVGMIFREVRCLSKTDDLTDRGINLSPLTKNTADASWEGHLCLFDEAFQLYFTPEESRKDLLNGNDAVAGEYITRQAQITSMKTQSKWDAVQEAFLGTYIYLLRNYRRFLIFPSKENEGSYGGADFQSRQFVFTQPFAMQPFLKKLVTTQMFDDFITKRLYGSGEADVTFFDQAIIQAAKTNSLGSSGGPFARIKKGFRNDSKNEIIGPLLQSARIHNKLMTIVPPEPSGSNLTLPPLEYSKSVPYKGAMLSISYPQDDAQSVGSNSTGTGSIYSFQSEKNHRRNQQNNIIGTYMYTYPIFPSNLDDSLFGVARPLPSAVLSEFDKQREDAARFRRRLDDDVDLPKFNRIGVEDVTNTSDPQIATFTVFFVSFTGVVGKELMEISDNPRALERTILSNYKPPPPKSPRPAFPVPSMPDMWDSRDSWGGEIIEFPTYSKNRSRKKFTGSNDTPQSEKEKVEVEQNGNGIHKSTNGEPNTDAENGDKDEIPNEEDVTKLKEETDNDSATSPTDDSTIVSALSDFSDMKKKVEVNDTKEESTKNKENNAVDSNKAGSDKVEEPRSRFYDALSVLEIEEARETARAQLGLAFEILGMLRKRNLQADPESYQCLIDASGRCGDTDRATKLLSWMHEDGIVADGVVYSCLVSAFSTENAWRKLAGKNDEDLPAWANGATAEMDWNKLRKQSYMVKAMKRIKVAKNKRVAAFEGDPLSNKGRLIENVNRWVQVYKPTSKDSETKSKPMEAKKIVSNKVKTNESFQSQSKKNEYTVTNNVLMQIMLGENLLELIYPDISIDTENETCPRCHTILMDDDVVAGWTAGDSQDYTTECPHCTQRFVPHFCVQSTSPSFLGSRGPSSPLFCERLSPWVLLKELRSVISDKEGIENILRPEWRAEATKNATLWWNLVLSFMRYRLPFSFLLQGNFQTSLITPTPESAIL